MLNEKIQGIDDRFPQETLNLILSMGKLLKLQLNEPTINAVSEAF